MEGCGVIEERNVSLKWEARCVDLEIEMPSGPRRLHIPSLHDEITGAHFRKKEDIMEHHAPRYRIGSKTWAYDRTSSFSRRESPRILGCNSSCVPLSMISGVSGLSPCFSRRTHRPSNLRLTLTSTSVTVLMRATR
ncbi:unnamed protein product [Ascophyllum nodosum]